MKYLVILEHGESTWGAHVPDLPGCIAAAKTREQVLERIREAIGMHIDSLRASGEEVPPPTSEGETVEVSAA
ncbi:MAG TPA: type II toxin-antitoxin system HicB family antitoxin [Planctomycetes bacterium]|nr:type II toxin-antitoxin system HicB family antitoxin [Planctomycetota bacterium]